MVGGGGVSKMPAIIWQSRDVAFVNVSPPPNYVHGNPVKQSVSTATDEINANYKGIYFFLVKYL